MKILLIEDDEFTTSIVVAALTNYNYQVETINDGQIGLELAKKVDYDLLLLDVSLLGLDGITLCRQIRFAGYQMPILILTGKDSTSMRVMGLEAGADDYVAKPFDLLELIARIKALLRRGKEILPTVLIWENLQLNTNTKEVTYTDKHLHLTPKEYGLLELFLRSPQRIYSRRALLDKIWSSLEFPSEEAVTTQIKGLRQKLKVAGMNVDLIETVYGLGYRLKEEQDKSIKRQRGKRNREQYNLRISLSGRTAEEKGVWEGDYYPNSNLQLLEDGVLDPSRGTELTQKQQAEAKVMAVVANMWEEFKQTLGEQIKLFEQVQAHLSDATPNLSLLKQATAQAHRLAGSLGCYSLLEGSKIAREIERLLEESQTTPKQNVTLQLGELIKSLKKIVRQQSLMPTASSLSRVSSGWLLIIDDDAILTERVELEAKTHGFQVEIAANLKTARSILVIYSPDVILLDLSFSDPQENGLKLLAELNQSQPDIPVLVFTSCNQLSKRVEAVSLGACGFLSKTMSASEVISVVKTALKQHHMAEAKILVVDDDSLVLNRVTALLSPWGIQLTTLQDSQRFWDVLEYTVPDLLILDIEMPDFSGIELCQAVRNDPRWNQLSVLFLSVHSDTEIVHKVYAAGADDYVKKPFVESELIVRILNRLERIRLKEKVI
ncbi:response regulator [Chlorogloeopsis sp. ULAP02]|uniref:response regulator n=1 Tax=Chlorogloeopsis sp. ULAP02 TaxID=3107926 RepID=UPI0031347511